MSVTRPQPRPNEISQPFWSATAEGRFMIQRCNACAEAIFYPRTNCTACGSTDLAWEQASGQGTVYTYTVARRPTHRAFAEVDPIVLAIVELAEGPHVTTNIVDVDPDDVRIGMAVELVFEPESDGIAIPVFTPTGA